MRNKRNIKIYVVVITILLSVILLKCQVIAKNNTDSLTLSDFEEIGVIPHEIVNANVKTITIENTGNKECYVRVSIIKPDNVTVTGSGEGWIDGKDGYWYYQSLFEPGASTGALNITLSLPMSTEENPIEEGWVVNIITAAEATLVLDDGNGNIGPSYKGWQIEI